MKTLLCFALALIGSIACQPTASGQPRGLGPGGYVPAETAYNSNTPNPLVRQVQLALERRGYYVGLNSGEFVYDTRRAIRRFRTKHGLPINGKIDHDLLVALRLH